MKQSEPNEQEFLRAWLEIEREGGCDAPFGAEYRRCWAEYCLHDHGFTPLVFIYLAANRSPAQAKQGK